MSALQLGEGRPKRPRAIHDMIRHMKRGTYERTPEVRAKQREAQRRRWAERNAVDYAGALIAFYELAHGGAPKDVLLPFARRALSLCPPEERPRWNKWVEACERPGGRIGFKTAGEHEELVHESVQALLDARVLLDDDEALRRALEEMNE